MVRQQGTKWWPGNNVGIGKDHTIFATSDGKVKFHKGLRVEHLFQLFRSKTTVPSSFSKEWKYLFDNYTLGLLLFAISMVATPGPAEAFMILLSAGSQFGFKKSIPFVIGIILSKQIII